MNLSFQSSNSADFSVPFTICVVPNFPYQCMGFTASSQRDFIKMDLGPALADAGYGADKFTLMAMDDQRFLLPYWANVVSVIE